MSLVKLCGTDTRKKSKILSLPKRHTWKLPVRHPPVLLAGKFTALTALEDGDNKVVIESRDQNDA